ncbi:MULTISPECIES: hypothetical protein [Nitrosomonas]|nr:MULTISPECIES: hypothetical protein [Nitrosomonas]UVS60013.1 hypothetical protein NX761_10705 [Nitrosomonas sp. PLL12]
MMRLLLFHGCKGGDSVELIPLKPNSTWLELSISSAGPPTMYLVMI